MVFSSRLALQNPSLQALLIGAFLTVSAPPSIAQTQWSEVRFRERINPTWRFVGINQQAPVFQSSLLEPPGLSHVSRSHPSKPSLPVVVTAHPQSNPAVSQVSDLPSVEPISPFVTVERPWPSPSLNPGVPSAFIGRGGDLFGGISGATRGKLRPDVDGSWFAGFGFGDPVSFASIELTGGCGSIKRFCGNGGFGAQVSRLLINEPRALLSVSAAWPNFIQWGYEGEQDRLIYGAISYAVPLRSPSTTFAQTLQLNAGVGNSTLAPYSSSDAEGKLGAFASIGVELSPAFGLSAGWSGRGVNAQASYTPFRSMPLTLNVLGADLLNQTPFGAVAVFTIGWGGNFATPNFNSPTFAPTTN